MSVGVQFGRDAEITLLGMSALFFFVRERCGTDVLGSDRLLRSLQVWEPEADRHQSFHVHRCVVLFYFYFSDSR